MVNKSPLARPVGTLDALRDSIQKYGVIHPVSTTLDGQIVDGEQRMRIAKELRVPCPTQVVTTVIRGKDERTLSGIVREVLIRQHNESNKTMDEQIIYLADRYTADIIAAALGLTREYVYGVLETTPERRTVNGRTDTTVTTAVEPMPAEHEVLRYIPPPTTQQYEELRNSIRAQGQRVPILLTPDGKIIDGRARWQICRELGITPITEIVTTNPWEMALMVNAERFGDYWERMLLVAKLPIRKFPPGPGYMDVPPQEVACRLMRVPYGAARVVRRLANTGGQVILDAVMEGVIRLGTAARMLRELPPESWDAALTQIRNEYMQTGDAVKLPTRNSRDYRRYAPDDLPGARPFITPAQLRKIEDQLLAVQMLLAAEPILDTKISSDQAAHWEASLVAGRRHLGRVIRMLRERKENT